MRECHLVNYQSGKQIKTRSVKEFCSKSGLDKQDKFAKIHVYSILNESRFSHLGWCLPKFLTLKVKIKDFYGNSYNEKVIDYPKKYNIPIQRIWSLYKRKKDTICGLSLYETEIKCIPPKNYKVINYKLITPNNKILKGKTITSLHRQIGLNNITRKSLYSLKQGRFSKIKGYSIKEIKVSKRSILKQKS